LLPVGLVLYIMGTPGRKRVLRARRAEEQLAYEARQAQQALDGAPDAGGQAPADTVAPVRKET
jgi:hypothetical protein